MSKDKNSSCNIIKFKIDASKFNSTMDRLANNYSTPKKVTAFERKVGESVCRAAELAMADLEFNPEQPKYRVN